MKLIINNRDINIKLIEGEFIMKTSKTTIAIGLALLLSVSFLSGCKSGDKVKPSLSEKGATTSDTSQSDKGGTTTEPAPSTSNIVIPAPSGWTKVDSSYVVAQYVKDTASFIVKTETFKGKTLEDIAKEDAGYLAKAFDKAKFAEPKKMQVGGKDAIQFTFTNGEGIASMKFETILIMSGVSTYTITCADLESSFDAVGFDKIVSSIEFK
jgi:hypothetical protein